MPRQFQADLANKTLAYYDRKTLATRKPSTSRAYLHRLIRKLSECRDLSL